MSSSAKAIVAFVLAFLTSLLAQVQDKTEFSDLTGLQWLVAVVSAIVTAGAVYLIPNGAPAPAHRGEVGQAPVLWILAVVGVVLLVLLLVGTLGR